MEEPAPTWDAVLSVVPEARSVPQSRSDAVTQHVETLPRSPQESTPGRMLAEVLTVAAGPAGESVREVLTRDTARRAEWAHGPAHRWTPWILLAPAAIAMLLCLPSSSRYGGSPDPMFDPDTALLVAGVLALVSVVGLFVLELRSRAPRGLLSYRFVAVLLAVCLGVALFRVDPDSYRPLLDQLDDYLLQATIGTALMVVAVIGFFALDLLARRHRNARPSPLGYTEDALRFDEELLVDVRQAVHSREDVHPEALRAQAVTGVHELFDTERLDALGATRMLRELMEHYPPAEAPRA